MDRCCWWAIPTWRGHHRKPGTNPKVAVVYVAAFPPEEGETLAEWPRIPAHPGRFWRDSADRRRIPPLTHKGVFDIFAQEPNPEEKALVFLQLQGPHKVPPEHPSRGAWIPKPSWVRPSLPTTRLSRPNRKSARRKRMGAKTMTLPSSHLPCFRTERGRDFVIEAAASLGGSAAAAGTLTPRAKSWS